MITRTRLSLVLACLALPCITFGTTPLVLDPTATVSSPAPYNQVTGVALDGDELVMGTLQDLGDLDVNAAAFLFRRQSDGSWKQVQTLWTGSGSVAHLVSVAIRGNLLAVHFGSALHVFERGANGFQASPVDPDWSFEARPEWNSDLEIEGSAITFGGGPDTVAGSCTGYNVRTFRKNSSGVWAPTGLTGSSDPAQDFLCVDQSDVATSGNLTVLGADPLADGTAASYIFTGPSSGWNSSVRLAGNGDPVAVENGTIIAGGTEVYRQSAGAWQLTQSLRRADRLMRAPIATELRNKIAAVSFGRRFAPESFGSYVSVYQADANNRFTDAAWLHGPFNDLASNSLDISGRRIVANSLFTGKALVFDVPTSFAQPATLQETFEAGTAANWTPVAGSSWAVTPTTASRVYRQTSLAGDAGSYLANTNWTNQSIQADVTPTAFSGSDRGFGLAVQRTDAANYYYVTARTTNVLQLKKLVNGVSQTLFSTALPVAAGTTYRLRLEAIGTTITAYVNDEPLIRVVDTSHRRGLAGLQMYKTAANYDNVVVSPSPQVGLFADDFKFVDDPLWSPVDGAWATPSGTYAQSSQAGDARSVTGASTRDQSVKATARVGSFASGGDRWVGLLARYVNPTNYYYVTLRNTNTISLRKLVNGAITVLDSAPLSVTPGSSHAVRFEAIQDQLRVYVNGQHVLEAADSTFSEGRYGLVTFKATANYDDVLVTQP